jgi:hypothetical protein
MPAIQGYDPSAGGPSQSAQMDTLLYQNNLADAANRTDLGIGQRRNTNDYLNVAKPRLESSLGATGQSYGTAADMAKTQQGIGFENAQADLQTGFDRAHMDLQRQQAFAAMGLIL